MTRVVSVLIALTSLLRAEQPGLRREGGDWVETSTGSQAAGDGDQLKITTAGSVSVHGGAHGVIEFTVTRRIRAHDEAQARDAFQETGASLTRQGRYMHLVVNPGAGAADLQVSVPRSLHALIVGTESGSMEFSDLEGSVQARTEAGEARMNHIKGNVDLITAGGAVHLGDVGGWVRVNTAAGEITADSIGGEARLVTAGGDITIQKAGANIRADTAGGKVRIAQAAGAVIATTAGGMIDIGRAGGAVTAHNAGGGPILIGSAAGAVRCDNASGAIKVGSLDGATRLVTASGSIVAQLHGARLSSDSYITTGSGDITVFIPSNMSVSIRAQNDGVSRAQSIVSDFPGLQIYLDSGSAIARGDVNGGGATLRIEGNSGTIWIRKK